MLLFDDKFNECKSVLITIQQEHSGDEDFSGERVFLNWGQFPVMVSLPQSILDQFDWWQ